MAPEVFPVAVPQLGPAHGAAPCTPPQSPEYDRELVVQPDDRRCPGPDDVSCDAVVAVGHPAVAGQRLVQLAPEDVVGGLGPVRTVPVGVELNMRDAQSRRQVLREGRLS